MISNESREGNYVILEGVWDAHALNLNANLPNILQTKEMRLRKVGILIEI